MTEIIIPKDLLPRDGRFGCGPSKLRPEQIQALQTKGFDLLGTSHRQAPIKNLVKELQAGLLELFHNPAGYEIVLGNGGSTAFWDVASYSLIDGPSQALVHGEFGAKFAKAITAPFLTKPEIIEAPVGSRGELVATSGIQNYIYPQNETSTGVQTPVRKVAGDSDAIFFTDATSAAGGIDFAPAETDVYYFAPQKNFSSDGGLWLALVSPKAIARAERIASSDRYIPEFLSFMTALENSRLNQTLNTPAIATLFLLNEQVNWINQNGGLSWADARTEAMSDYLYNWISERDFVFPFVVEKDHQSQVVVTMDFKPELDASHIAKVLRANSIVDTEPYRKLGRNQLRIATFVSTELSDVQKLCSAIDYVVERM